MVNIIKRTRKLQEVCHLVFCLRTTADPDAEGTHTEVLARDSPDRPTPASGPVQHQGDTTELTTPPRFWISCYGRGTRANEEQLLWIRCGPGALVLPKDVTKIAMEFNTKIYGGHQGARYVVSSLSPDYRMQPTEGPGYRRGGPDAHGAIKRKQEARNAAHGGILTQLQEILA
jgi:hypothetical protein